MNAIHQKLVKCLLVAMPVLAYSCGENQRGSAEKLGRSEQMAQAPDQVDNEGENLNLVVGVDTRIPFSPSTMPYAKLVGGLHPGGTASSFINCTASLVWKNLAITAKHCVSQYFNSSGLPLSTAPTVFRLGLSKGVALDQAKVLKVIVGATSGVEGSDTYEAGDWAILVLSKSCKNSLCEGGTTALNAFDLGAKYGYLRTHNKSFVAPLPLDSSAAKQITVTYSNTYYLLNNNAGVVTDCVFRDIYSAQPFLLHGCDMGSGGASGSLLFNLGTDGNYHLVALNVAETKTCGTSATASTECKVSRYNYPKSTLYVRTFPIAYNIALPYNFYEAAILKAQQLYP